MYYYGQQKAPFQIDQKVPLNDKKSIFLTQIQDRNEPKPCIMKCYLNDNNQQQRLWKLQNIQQDLVIKPKYFRLEGQKVFMVTQIQQMSLQNLLFLHKMHQYPIPKEIIKSFVKIFDIMNKLKKESFYHGNLKPSNIFIKFPDQYLNQIKEEPKPKQSQPPNQKPKSKQSLPKVNPEDIKWRVSEAGINPTSQNRYYSKMKIAINNASKSFYMEPLQNDYFSLAIILLQMTTLQPIQKIHEDLCNNKITFNSSYFEELRESEIAREHYQDQKLFHFILALLNPKELLKISRGLIDNISGFYRSYEQSINYPKNIQIPIDYREYFITPDVLVKNFKNENDKTIQNIILRMKDCFLKQQINVAQMFKFMNRSIDPEDDFFFPTSKQMKTFFDKLLKFEFSHKIHPLLFSIYFTLESHVYYMIFMTKIFNPVELANGIIIKALQKFDSATDLFESQTNSKDYWRAEDIRIFFYSLNVPFQKQQINKIVQSWASKEKATMVRLEQFKRKFNTNDSPVKENKKTVNSEKAIPKIQEMLQQLKKKLPDQNFIHFFRLMPGQHKWQVPMHQVVNEIKKYYKFKNRFDEIEIFQAMLNIGRLDQDKKAIDYIRLLLKIKIQEPINLFRKVLVERMNEDGMETIYRKYEKSQNQSKGWTLQSLTQFCQKQYLDFSQRDISSFFDTLDKNNDKCVDYRELTEKLTGIKHFDFDLIVGQIKDLTNDNGQKVYNAFLQVDRQRELILRNIDDLAEVFECLNQKRGDSSKFYIEPSHLQQLYAKFTTNKGTFEYLSFLRCFCKLQLIFFKTSKLLIQSMYKGDFEKFFRVGLKGQQKKWKRNSLNQINDSMILGFTQNQLDQLWKIIDKNKQQSMTKQQIAELFEKHVQKLQEFKGRNVESLNDFRPKKKEDDRKENRFERNPKRQGIQQSNKLTFNQENQLQKNQLVVELKSMKLLSLISRCLRRSQPRNSVWIQPSDFCSILQQQRVSCTKKYLQTNFPYCLKSSSSTTLFNYLKFFFLISQFKMDSEKQKAECLGFMLGTICSSKKLNAIQIFDRYRIKDGQMKLSKFEVVVKEILDDQIFFEDIEGAWSFWGYPKFITSKGLQKILDEAETQKLRNFLKSESDDSKYESKQHVTPVLRSGQTSERQKIRKQSTQSFQIRKPQKGLDRMSFQRQANTDAGKFSFERKRSDPPFNKQDQRIGREKYDQDRQHQRKPSQDKRTSMQANLYPERRESSTPLSKRELLAKFEQKLQQRSTQEIARLFMDTNKVEKDDFAYCLMKYYDFSKRQAEQLSQHLGDFGVIKIETVKKYMRPGGRQTKGRQQPSRYNRQKQRTVQFSEKTPDRFESDKLITPVTRQSKPQNILKNPRKQKLNTPLIKQQIKMLIRSFSQRYAIQQIDRYFFEQSDIIQRDEFIKKSKVISQTLTEQNLEKIYQFLKPNQKDQVNILNFKMAFSFDQNIEVQPDYLPKELITQLQQLFNSHDKDHSGFIQASEIEALLSSLGFNQTQKQIENVFQKIDKNFDNQISFNEFKDFIEEFILPHLVEFENDVDELFNLLKMNDVFNTGCVSINVLLVILDRFGVKLTNQEGVYLAKYIGNENDQIPIYDFISALYNTTNPAFPPIVKSALYKVKLRQKISLKQIQKTFSNISSNFVMAYTSRIIRSQLLKRSTAFEPVLHESYMFYQDFYYKDFRSINSSSFKNDRLLVDEDPKSLTTIVELRIPEACGVPIPQNPNIKGTILKRAMNITFFDMSAQTAKYSIVTLEADWDAQIEDQWTFALKNRSVFMKIANYDAKKYEKIIILFELVITMNDNSRLIEVSCGSSSVSVKQLISIENKFTKKLKLVSGIPTKAKQIDKVSVSKRTGWKSFLSSSNIESQLSVDIINQKNIDKQSLSMLYSLPSICLVKRKSLHYIWTFREYFAQRCVDKDMINPQFINTHTVRTFLLSLDVEDISSQIYSFWKDKVEQNLKGISDARAVLYNFLTDLYMILNSKQFQLKLSNPSATVINVKSLYTLRQKMVGQIFENIENYVKNDLPKGKPYRRLKNYNYSYSPIMIQFGRGSLQSYLNQNTIKIGKN